MKEPFPGVMQMACNTFQTIAMKCKEEFVSNHSKYDENQKGEQYIHELIRKISDEILLLNTQQKLQFYESVGHMISAEKDPSL
jgi:hypothetical protein